MGDLDNMSKIFIDTKGTCLLCLKPKSVFKRTRNSEDDSRTSTAFKMLLRYLKVDVTTVTKLAHLTSFSENYENVNLLVTMCDECSSIANSFVELFQTFENIRLQLDMLVHKLQNVMETGAKDQRRVREYDKRMSTGDRNDKRNDSMAKSLRNETLAKASSKVAGLAPRISLQNITPKSMASKLETVALEGGRRKSPRTGSIQSFPDHELLPGPSSNIKLEAEANWSEEANDERDPLHMEREATEEEEDQGENMDSDVGYCHDDDGGANTIDSQSDIETDDDDGDDDDDDDTEKVVLAPKRRSRTAALLRIDVDLATEKYYDKSKKRTCWKCNLCGDTFTEGRNLQTHKLRKHLMTVIRDKLPETVSENRVDLALNRIIARTPVISKNHYGSLKYECHFCKKKEWKSTLGVHFLQKHFDKVIEEVEDCKDIIEIEIPNRRKRNRKQSKPDNFREEGQEKSMNSDVGYTPEDNSVNAAYNRSDLRPGKSREATVRKRGRPYKFGLFKVDVDLATEKYYDKSRKRFRWKCNLCGDTFTESGNLQTHKLRKHMMAVIKDKLPDTVSEKRVTLALNRIIGRTPIISKNRYGSPQYECLFCKKKEWSMLKSHMLKYHLDNVIEEVGDCEDMEIEAPMRKKPKPAKPKPPASRSRNLKFKCDKCGASLPSAFAVKQHKIKDHLEMEADDYLKCDYCERPFTQTYNLRGHLIRNHPAAFFADKLPPGISDDIFNEALQCILDMAQDIGNSHIKDDPNSSDDCIIECPYCGKRSTLSTNMRVHIANYHLDEVIEEATRGGFNVSSDISNSQLKTEAEAVNVEEGINPEDIKLDDGDNERTNLVISDLNPRDKKEEYTSQNQPRSPAKKATHLHKSDQRVGQFWKIQRKYKSPKSYKCDHCGMNFTEKPNLESHKYRKHTMIVLKDRLPPSISKEDVMKGLDMIIAKSERNPHTGRQRATYDCLFCNRKLYEYRIHLLQSHLAEIVQEVEENVGDPSFKTSRIVQLKKTKTCGICGEYFLSPHTLRVHKAEKHPEDSGKVEEEPFMCHYCHKNCNRAHSLRGHLAVEHPAAYYAACMPPGVSDKDFKDVVTAMVDKMMEIGKSKATFSCIHCDKSFNKTIGKTPIRLHFAHVHLNKVLEELKKRMESLVDNADESSDNPRTED